MDYKKLADLLYPNVKENIDFYFNKYPKRVLGAGAEVTRIAPSPTGFLHIGGLYQAVIHTCLAYTTNGIFYMRLEDTDQKREIKDAGTIAYDILCYYGLKPSEGYCGENAQEKGDYGPYVQSKRKDIYDCFAKHLVSVGRGFPCFCEKADNKDDILKRREEMLESDDTIVEKDPCRELTYEQIEQNIKDGKKFALRLKSQGDLNKTIKIVDRIKGERDIRENGKDIILIKSNGLPVYAFAHLVDDTLMGTTTVVRGEEWYQSLSSHLELFDALGLQHPKYAHTPVICKLDNGNKRKLSKRKDKEADSRYYVEQGYPIFGVVEYLLNLANSDFEMWRSKNPNLSYLEFPFSIDNIGSNNPMFDFNKLNDICKNVIAKMDDYEVYENVIKWAKEYNKQFYDILLKRKAFAINVFDIDREGEKPRKDIAKWNEVQEYYNYMFNDYNTLKFDLTGLEKLDKNILKKVMENFLKTYNELDEKTVWFDKIKRFAEELNFCLNNKEYKLNPQNYNGNVATLCTIIRVIITGKQQTPDLYSICKLLGKNELKNRVEQYFK